MTPDMQQDMALLTERLGAMGDDERQLNILALQQQITQVRLELAKESLRQLRGIIDDDLSDVIDMVLNTVSKPLPVTPDEIRVCLEEWVEQYASE